MEPRQLDEIVRNVGDTITDLVRTYYRLGRDKRSSLKVTNSQAQTLLSFAAQEKLTMNQLSQRMGLSTSTMTRNIDNLAQRGLVERVRDATDRRLVFVRPTARGRELVEDIIQSQRAHFAQVMNSIPVDRRGEIQSSLEILLKSMEDALQRGAA
ncbi:MAG: MarR family transcriptional regulator [Candidatus Omnitrophica bacterium]|nr:MarR family transcriptional regulator [Candidatus Omnitrophota bacterium]